MSVYLRAGDLAYRITLQAPTYTTQLDGERVISGWVDQFSRWANVEPLTGREYLQAMTVEQTITHRITCRYDAAIHPDWRVKWGSRYFNIVSVRTPEEAQVSLEIMAVERING